MQGQQQPRMQHLSPEGVAHLSQNKLLPLLLHRALGANEPHSIRLGHAVESVQQGQQGVSCRVATAEVSCHRHHHVPSTNWCVQPSQGSTVQSLSAAVQMHDMTYPSTGSSGDSKQGCLCWQQLHGGLAQLDHCEWW